MRRGREEERRSNDSFTAMEKFLRKERSSARGERRAALRLVLLLNDGGSKESGRVRRFGDDLTDKTWSFRRSNRICSKKEGKVDGKE